jgi:hypothetical protein
LLLLLIRSVLDLYAIIYNRFFGPPRTECSLNRPLELKMARSYFELYVTA